MAAGAGSGGIKADAIVGDFQEGGVGLGAERNAQGAGEGVAGGVTEGFADDGEELGALREGEAIGEDVVDLGGQREAGRGETKNGGEELGKCAVGLGRGFEAADGGAEIADDVVEIQAGFFEERFGGGGAGGEEGADGGEAEAGGVDAGWRRRGDRG
jgi:hypothetical protein